MQYQNTTNLDLSDTLFGISEDEVVIKRMNYDTRRAAANSVSNNTL